MKFYVLTKDQIPVSISFVSPFPVTDPSVSAHTFDETFPDLNVCSWNPELEKYEETGAKLSKLGFLKRFTLQERIAIRNSQDPVVKDIMELFNAAEFIDVLDASTQQAVAYLVDALLITAERAQEILR